MAVGKGLADVRTNIYDDVQPQYGTPTGVCAVIGHTTRGEIATPTIIETVLQFTRTFGSVLVDGDFAHSCIIALEAGATLLVSRLVNYTVVGQVWTPTGIVATSALASCRWRGTDGNSISITIAAAVSGIANKKDIFVTLDGVTESLRDVPATLVLSDINAINARFTNVTFFTSLTSLADGTTTLSGGTNPTEPLAADYVGNSASATGVYSFDGYNGFDFIAAFGIAQNTVDIALSDYVTLRSDCNALLRTPTGLLGTEVVKYRKAIAPYAGTFINNWRARMTTGGVKVASKLNSTVVVQMSESPLYAAALCRKNATGSVWLSVGAPRYSYLSRVIGVAQNFLGNGRKAEADTVVNAGVVPIVQEQTGRVRIFGDSTMQMTHGFLQNANIADTITYITNGVREIYNQFLFEPNDIPTWRHMHVQVMNFLKPIVDGGGIRAYAYKGDQDANSFASLTVNSVPDINEGQYKVIIEIFPTTVMKHIEISINLTANLAVDVSVSSPN